MFETGDMGQVTIKHTDIANVDYRYEIDSGSTVKKDEILENQTLTEILGLVMKIPGAMQMLAQGGKIPLGNMQLDMGELMKRWIISSGVTDWDKIIVDNESAGGGVENALNMENPDVANAIGQAFPLQGQLQQGQMPGGEQQNEFSDPAIAQVFAELQGLGGGQMS
jgi:hypothetical protein